MSLDVYLKRVQPSVVYTGNVMHNLNRMATAAGLYEILWRPEEVGITKAAQLIKPLRAGLNRLKRASKKFKEFNPPTGWGHYDVFVGFVETYLHECEENPDCDVEVSR